MKIDKYLIKHEMTQAEFASMLNVTEAAVSYWLSGKRTPTPALANKIVKITGGEITFQDIYKKEA